MGGVTCAECSGRCISCDVYFVRHALRLGYRVPLSGVVCITPCTLSVISRAVCFVCCTSCVISRVLYLVCCTSAVYLLWCIFVAGYLDRCN